MLGTKRIHQNLIQVLRKYKQNQTNDNPIMKNAQKIYRTWVFGNNIQTEDVTRKITASNKQFCTRIFNIVYILKISRIRDKNFISWIFVLGYFRIDLWINCLTLGLDLFDLSHWMFFLSEAEYQKGFICYDILRFAIQQFEHFFKI